MTNLPPYLWVFTYATIAAMQAATAYVLYRGARAAGITPRRSAALGAGALVLFGGWLIASSLIAGGGHYRTRLGHGLPWLPVAVVGSLATLMLLARTAPVRRALHAPGGAHRLMLAHAFRIEGIVFLIALALGKLPALFAVPAGVGDITVGIATPWITRRLSQRPGDSAAVWFNLFGVADLISALTLGALTGFRIVSVSPAATLNGRLPLALVPTVGVPLLLALHITSLTQLRAAARADAQAAERSAAAARASAASRVLA